MEQLSIAVKLTPKDATILEHLGDCSLKLGNAENARSYWEKSLEVEENESIRAKIDTL